MANEITVQVYLRAAKGFLDVTRSPGQLQFTLAAASPAFGARAQAVGTSAHEALDVGDVATPGWCYLRNLDATNFVEIGVDVTGAFAPLIKLKAGEPAVIRLAAAPYAKADTAAVKLEYLILDD